MNEFRLSTRSRGSEPPELSDLDVQSNGDHCEATRAKHSPREAEMDDKVVQAPQEATPLTVLRDVLIARASYGHLLTASSSVSVRFGFQQQQWDAEGLLLRSLA